MKQLTIVGNLGYDATLKEVNGNKFLEFSVAVTEKYKKQDGTTVENTDWISCTYRGLGIQQYLKKGGKVLVQGNMKVNVYQAKDRSYKAGININATNIELLSSKKEDTNGEVPAVAETPAPASVETIVDDLPF